ncbi:glycosyltransferase family 2 protein [Rossellomorea vietnamensis]|uniref:glycosyltransferase family 2 protein n=1 Tax=Rossellomorea vietnamensis TaxID=218284 RepID=UPI0022860630|nr:glycosyltransferase family A protein [Rossellomorea vietnamensis]
MPVFNGERYLSRCINSIRQKASENIEIILINDGSTDNSGKICDEFAKKDESISVKHIQNSGVSIARNIGISMSRGSWLFFLDCDDYIEQDTIDIINKCISTNNQYDMILGSFNYVRKYSIDYIENRYYSTEGVSLVPEYGLWKVKILMGSFVVKRAVVINNKISFNENTLYGEDVEFINYCLINSKEVKVIPNPFFNYNIHEESAIGKVNFRRFDSFEARSRTLNYIRERHPEKHNIEQLYTQILLPEAIIENIILLCRNGKNLYKIKKFLLQKNYYSILQSAEDSEFTPDYLKIKIRKFLKNERLMWVEYFIIDLYYKFRENLGLFKRRIFGWK